MFKSIKFLTTIFLFVGMTFSACQAQTKGKNQSLSFKVWGNCEMCKKTIETSLDVKGVKSAEWNAETKMLAVVFNAEKVNETKLHELVAATGYDTEKQKGSDKAYKELPDCCQYTRK